MPRFWYFYFLLFTSSLLASEIISFSPAGKAKNIVQVKVRFSEVMVPMGTTQNQFSPFKVNCKVVGTPRWTMPKEWVYDFDRPLPAGTRCLFTLKRNLKSQKGNWLRSKQREYIIETGGVNVYQTHPHEQSNTIKEDQAFVLVVNGEVNTQSVLKHVHFTVEGIKEKIPIKLITGKLKDKILKRTYFSKAAQDANKIIIQAKRKFPSAKQIQIVWSKDVATKNGIKNSEDQILTFSTREPLRLSMSCERKNAQSPCSPLRPIQLTFSNSLSIEQQQHIIVKDQSGNEVELKFFDYSKKFASFKINPPHHPNGFYEISLQEKGSKIVDVDDRKLSNRNSFPLKIDVDELPPLAKFPANFGIIEWKANPALPLTIRNLEPDLKSRLLSLKDRKSWYSYYNYFADLIGAKAKLNAGQAPEIIQWLQEIDQAGTYRVSLVDKLKNNSQGDIEQSFKIPSKLGNKAFEVLAIPLKNPGFYVIEIQSENINRDFKNQFSKNNKHFVTASALVTDMAVHFKKGIENSLVWVTSLNSGKPIAGARVSIWNSMGEILWQSKTNEWGWVKTNKKLLAKKRSGSINSSAYNNGLFVFAEKGTDLSFTHTSWNKGIENWRFNSHTYQNYGNYIGTGLLSRSLLRAGETLHGKNILRKHTIKGFAGADQEFINDRRELSIQFGYYGDEEVAKIPLRWENGKSIFEWEIPKNSKLGTYRLVLKPAEIKAGYAQDMILGDFMVQEFSTPLSRAHLKGPVQTQVTPKFIPLSLGVEYLSGGGAGGLNVKLKTQFYEAYSVPHPNKSFKPFIWDLGIPTIKDKNRRSTPFASTSLKLDASGTKSFNVTKLPRWKRPYNMTAELEYQDANGEYKTKLLNVPIFPSKLRIGIKPKTWLAPDQTLHAKAAITNQKGVPLAKQKVTFKAYRIDQISHRTKLVGGFYGYNHHKNLKSLGVVCETQTDKNGIADCTKRMQQTGNIVIQAQSVDKNGFLLSTYTDIWIPGKEDWWFSLQNSDRIDFIPEKEFYGPGETARFQVQAPFREFTALITVEREGVIDQFVKNISGKSPVVEIPILSHYSPNVHVSILAIRGRVDKPKATAIVDLAKPSYKVGTSEIKVGYKGHQLQVDVALSADVVNIREVVTGKVKVTKLDGNPLDKDSEVAIAVVDKGLLQLSPNKSWDLLNHMMQLRNNNVATSTAQLQVVGKRHYGKKALPAGGDGGESNQARELFATLLYWHPSLKLNHLGEANFEFKAQDALTEYKVVALATSGMNHFGKGSNTFKTNKDLAIFSGIPAVARIGDQLELPMTLKNTLDRQMNLDLTLKIEGIGQTAPINRKIELAPLASKVEIFKVSIPKDSKSIKYTLTAMENEKLMDQILIKQEVSPVVPVRTYQSLLKQLNQNIDIPIEQPATSQPGRGGLDIILTQSLFKNVKGITDFFTHYPYQCLEQKLSKVVALNDREALKEIIDDLPNYQTKSGLFTYFPNKNMSGSDVLTAYILTLLHEANHTLPSQVLSSALKGLDKFIKGTKSNRFKRNLPYLAMRKIMAVDALSRYNQATARHVGHLFVQPDRMSFLGLIYWINILHRVPNIADAQKKKIIADQVLRYRLVSEGTLFGFPSDLADSRSFLMSSREENAIRLLLTLLEFQLWEDDIPRVVNSVLAAQKKGHWKLTTANVLGLLALKKFSLKYESQNISGKTMINWGKTKQVVDWGKTNSISETPLAWPPKKTTLTLNHQGPGAPWALIKSNAAIPTTKKLFSGFQISKTIKNVNNQKTFKSGDIMEVTLKIKSNSPSDWVVVEDPIPSGSVVLNKGLADRTLGIKTFQKGAWSAYDEKGERFFRRYYSSTPNKEFSFNYYVRLNTAGVFNLPPTRVEAMYNPEKYAEFPNMKMSINP